jgi:antitoxin ParD1/3/4
MSLIASRILERLQALPLERQQVVLDLVEFMETDAWDSLYQGRLATLRQEIQIGLDASARGEVIDGEVLFDQLRTKLQEQRSES